MCDDRSVQEDRDKLTIFECGKHVPGIELLERELQSDRVTLLKGVSPERSDEIMLRVADRFGLATNLELQAGFAKFAGHRDNVGRYFMTVNKRDAYQYIPPHSEGTSSIGMQLASFYCFENSTDGGESIFFNISESGAGWNNLRERITRAKATLALNPGEISRIRGMYRLNPTIDILRDDESIVQESATGIPGFFLVDVLARARKTFSVILQRDVYSYWDSVASIDFDSATEFLNVLKGCGLLKEPSTHFTDAQFDNAADRRIYRSEVRYADLFSSRLTHKLSSGDLLLLNNWTWTHSASNWSPGSGRREIAAAFA
jgi:hypothetical protein